MKYTPTEDEVRRHVVASLKLEGIETSVAELRAIAVEQQQRQEQNQHGPEEVGGRAGDDPAR